jgi:hypothetical protein
MPKPKTIALAPHEFELLQKGRSLEWAGTVIKLSAQEKSDLSQGGSKDRITIGSADLKRIISGETVTYGTCQVKADEAQFGAPGEPVYAGSIVADIKARQAGEQPQEPETL